MRGFVAPTDYGWYKFLRSRPEIREVNFWRPSQNNFKALKPGELFFFKLKAPQNAIGGFGLFSRFAVLPVWEVWDVFGQANGVADVGELIERLARLTGSGDEVSLDSWIGCIAICEPVFFAPDEWVRVPDDWQRQIVSGSGYDLSRGEGRRMYEDCLEHARGIVIDPPGWVDEALDGRRLGADQLIRPRLGQSSFRLAVLDAYSGRCAVTGERSLPVIEASHIRPFAEGGMHEVTNGLPLRRDIHRLFDLGYVTVRPELRFVVSGALRDAYENGRVYYQLDGVSIKVPDDPGMRPDPELLDWHGSVRFRD